MTITRDEYTTKETHGRKSVLWVHPAEGSDREKRCGRVTVERTKTGQFGAQTNCPAQVEWVEFRKRDRSTVYSCDEHVTPRLEDQ